MKKIVILSLLAVLLSACGAESTPVVNAPGGMGMGPGGMAERHHAQVPAEYVNAKSPELSDEMLTLGAEVYQAQCLVCHGETGMGEGPAGTALDPAAAPVAHTSQMMGNAYLFWRVSEGGAQFSSAMPAWKDTLSEEEIWAVIGYIRALGSGEAARIQDLQHEQMLSAAIEQGLISSEEAETFTFVHDAMDTYRNEHHDELLSGNMDDHQAFMLDELVKAGTITRPQADDFTRIHQLLLDEGLMQ